MNKPKVIVAFTCALISHSTLVHNLFAVEVVFEFSETVATEQNVQIGGNGQDLTVGQLLSAQLQAAVPPTISISNKADYIAKIEYSGILQESTDLEEWRNVDPQPDSPFVVEINSTEIFYRSKDLPPVWTSHSFREKRGRHRTHWQSHNRITG